MLGSSRSRAILVATSIVECCKIISRFYSGHVQPFGSVAVYSGYSLWWFILKKKVTMNWSMCLCYFCVNECEIFH